MAKRMSSPLTVFRFSCWHFSEATDMVVKVSNLVKRLERRATHTFACDEGNKLAHAFLHAFFCFFCDFGIFRKGRFHYSSNWGKITNVSIGNGVSIAISRALLMTYRLRGFMGHDEPLLVEERKDHRMERRTMLVQINPFSQETSQMRIW